MPIRLVLLTLVTLTYMTSWAGVEIYEDGVKTFDCTKPTAAVQEPQEPQAPSDPTFGTIIFGHTGNSEGKPTNGQTLYDQALIAPGEIFLEVLTAGQSIHHMVWYDNGTKIRRENYAPYTARHTLTAGRHQIAAILYSSETQIIGTYRVEFFVGDGGASVEPQAPAEQQLVSVQVEWTPPQTRENGEPLAPGAIALYYLMVNSDSYTVPGSQSSYVLKLPSGDYVASLIAEDTAGLQSEPSLPYPFQL